LDVTLLEYNVVQPDLFYVSGEQKIMVKDDRIDGAPTLVVEVISSSGGRKDRVQKMRIYLKAGVKHYWLLDPQQKPWNALPGVMACTRWSPPVWTKTLWTTQILMVCQSP